MDYGHVKKMLGLLDRQNAWQKLSKDPLPKLTVGYMPAESLVNQMALMHMLPTSVYNLHGPDKMKALGFEVTDEPVSGRIFCLEEMHDVSSPSGAAQRERMDVIQDDLHELGCNTVIYQHTLYNDAGEPTKVQSCLFLPHLKIDDQREKLAGRPDIDGAAIMLAYLLQNGFVHEREIPPYDVTEYGQTLDMNAFGPVILKMAKSDEIQAKLHEHPPAIQRLGL